MRGIIITPPFSMEGDKFTLISSEIEPIKLRQYLLYWDKIDFPDSNIVSIGGSSEIRFLESTGILTRSNVMYNSWNGENLGNMFIQMQSKVFQEKNKREAGRWSIAQSNNSLIYPKEISTIARGLEIELYESIPVPSGEVNLEDILNFKERRKDELIEFRYAIDELYLNIINSNDIPRSKIKAIDKLQNNIATINRVMSESKMTRLLGSVKMDYDLTGAICNGFVGIAASSSFGVSPALGLLIGSLSSGIKISINDILKPKSIPNELKDYAYLYHAERSFPK